jgi:hypothetical protein
VDGLYDSAERELREPTDSDGKSSDDASPKLVRIGSIIGSHCNNIEVTEVNCQSILSLYPESHPRTICYSLSSQLLP